MLMDDKLEQESFNSRNQAGHPESHLNDVNSKNFKGKQFKSASGSYNIRNRRYRPKVEELDIKINQEITTKSLKKEIKEKLLTNKLDKKINDKQKRKLEITDSTHRNNSNFDDNFVLKIVQT